MTEPITEEYWWGENRQVLTPEQHHIPGVQVFGHSLNVRAVSPLERHVHPGCLELVLLVRGNQSYTVDGRTYPLSGGNVFISFPGEEHSSGGEPQNVSEIYWIQLELAHTENFLHLDGEASGQLCRQLQSISQRVLYCGEELRRWFAESFWNIASSDTVHRAYGRSLLSCFLHGIALQERAAALELSDEIAAAVTYIRQNLCEEIMLESLAQCAGLSLSRFKVRFKQETGMTPREYINQLKIREAKRMLQKGESITRTAQELGFGSSQYFAVVFKKITLYTPSEYRQNWQEQLHSK